MADEALAGRVAMRLGLPGNWLSLGAVMLTSTIIGMTLAFSFPLLSLVLDHRGIPADLIGLNSALNGLAVFVIAPWLPRLVNGSAWRAAWRAARRWASPAFWRCRSRST